MKREIIDQTLASFLIHYTQFAMGRTRYLICKLVFLEKTIVHE